MKYTIEGFSQKEAVRLGLDCDDLVLLRWIADFYHTGKMKEITVKDHAYFWNHYDTVADDLPIIGETTRQIAYRFKRLAEKGILSFHIAKDSKGTYTYYRFAGDVYSSLITDGTAAMSSDPQPKSGSAHNQKVVPGYEKVVPIDPSTKDSSTTEQREEEGPVKVTVEKLSTGG